MPCDTFTIRARVLVEGIGRVIMRIDEAGGKHQPVRTNDFFAGYWLQIPHGLNHSRVHPHRGGSKRSTGSIRNTRPGDKEGFRRTDAG